MSNPESNPDSQSQEHPRAHKHQQIQNALAPFEDDLIAQLPTPEQIIQAALARQQRNRQRIKKIFSLVLLAATGGLLYLDPAYNEQILTTGIGEHKEILLNDGSQLQLNTDTRLQVSYHLRSRRIDLQQGEAMFHVKHNAWHSILPRLERSFNVYVDNIKIQDIGTVFNVRKFADQDIQVTVLEGQVRVHTGYRPPIDLTTGQAFLSKTGLAVVLDQLAIDRLIAWQKGYLYFNDQPLSQVLNELERYSALSVKVQNKEIAELRISGQVNLQDPQQFVNALPTFIPVQIKRDKDDSILIQAK